MAAFNQPRELRLGANSEFQLNGGLCLDQESNILLSQSPYGGLVNMCCDDGGLPIKRPGQTDLFNNLVANFGINDIVLSQQITSALPTLASTPNLSIVDDGDSNIIYSGTWQIENNASVYGGTGRYSATTGDFIQYTFVGTGINVYCARYSNKGLARIYIDGIDKGTVDLYNATSQLKYKIYSITDLSYGTHTIKIVVTGTKNPSSLGYQIYFDYFEVIANEQWRLVTDKSNLNFATSIANNKIALLCEMDLTSFCSANYASVNADMKTKFYYILNNIIASSTGALGSGYDTYIYNFNTSAFELLTTFTVNHISSSNKVDLMFYPKYSSDGITPCSMNINSYSFSLIFLLLGPGKINGIYPSYKGKTIFAWNTSLYTQTDSNQPVLLYNGVTNSKAFFFVYNSILYIINGSQLLKYDGTNVSAITPYIPTISINRKPDGSQSTVNESWNLIGRGFKDKFNPDGTTKTFKLSFSGLDNDPVISNLNGTEGNGFTVNRITGEVTYTTAPPAGTNTLEITGYKTFSDNPPQILNCTRAYEAYGRIFMYGNPNFKNSYWVMGISDSNDCSYFPTKYKYSLTKTDKELTVFVSHFGLLIGTTEDLTFKIEESTFDNQASFPVKYLNTSIGCDMPGTMQLINNNPVWCNSYGGVYLLQSTLIEGEKDIKSLSSNINGTYERPGLLQENKTDLYNATSVDFGNKYYICVKNKCYVWDYQQSFSIKEPKTLTWYLYTNINAGCFMIRDNTLMYGDRDNGTIAKFVNVPNDFGKPILGLWRSKLMDFNFTDYQKIISDIWLTTRANSSSSITINYYNDQRQLLQSSNIPASQLKSFSWSNFSWDKFTWQVQTFSPTLRFRPKIKNVRYFQMELKNNVFNENLSIISLVIKYSLTKKVR